MKVAPRGSQPRGGSINHEDVHKEKDQWLETLQSPIPFQRKKNKMFHTQQQHVDNDAFMMNSNSNKENQCDHGEELRSTKNKLT
jgi:hypothetical protein